MLSNNVSENCLNCAIGIALKLGAIFGLPFFSIKCEHDIPNLKSTIIYSKYFLLSGLITLMVFVYSIATALIRLKNMVFSLDHIFDLLVTIPHFILYLCSAITILYGILRVKIIEKAYTSFQLTMENWRAVTSKVLLTTDDIAYLRFRTFLYTAGITSLFVISAVELFCIDTKSKPSGAQNFGRLITLYVIGVVMFILTLIDDYFKLVCRKFHNYLKADLESKFNFAIDEALVRDHTLYKEKLILTRKNLVSTYTQLHGRLIYSFQYMNQFLNPLVLIWVLGFTISMTVNGYLILTAFLDNYMNVFKPTLMAIEFEIGCSFALILFTAMRNSELRAVSDGIVTYLYKYSISKMNTTAANQLEFLIATLIAQKATLNCLDIMTIGLPLIASVSGTVITYVIIALQFQVIFTRKLYHAHNNATLETIMKPLLT